MKKPIGMGIFGYDLFPYMVVHSIKGLLPDGKFDCEYFYMKARSLIAIMPVKQGIDIKEALNIIKTRERAGIKELRKQLLKELYDKYPILDKKE